MIDEKRYEKVSWLYYTGRFFFSCFFIFMGRRRVIGSENIPKEGGVIIAPNHVSFADPPLTGSSMKRPLYFMAKQELFDIPVLGFLIRRTNAFPVKRGQQDVGAFRMALKLLKAGKAVLMFPEGTRSKDGNFGRPRAGVGMIACTAQVPVVPVRLVNSNHIFKGITVIFGKPVYPPKDYTKENYQQLSAQALEEIKKLA